MRGAPSAPSGGGYPHAASANLPNATERMVDEPHGGRRGRAARQKRGRRPPRLLVASCFSDPDNLHSFVSVFPVFVLRGVPPLQKALAGFALTTTPSLLLTDTLLTYI